MNCLILSKDKKLDRHKGVIEFLNDRGFHITHCLQISDRPDVFFDFYIIDEFLINNIKELDNTPFLVNIHSKSEPHELYNSKSCLGFIDLDSNPLVISSYLNIVLTNIKNYNKKHRSGKIENRFSDFDLTFFKTLPDGLVFQDKDGSILDVNPAAEKLLSATRDQLAGITSMDKRWHLTDSNRLPINGEDHPSMVALRTKKSSIGNIIGIISGENDFKWLKIDAIPIIINNEVDIIYTHFSDITEEIELHDKLTLLSSVFYYSPFSIVITDPKGTIQSVNPRFIEITGFNKEELVGQEASLFKSSSSNTNYTELWDTITKGNVWHGEFLNHRKNGELYSESAVIAPIKNEKDEITNYIGIKEDITGYKAIQKKLELTLIELEQLVQDRTTSLDSARSLTFESLATLSEYRDNETGAHIKRTKLYVKFILEKIKNELNYSNDDLKLMWDSAPLHDIGKVGIPDNILLKEGKLTEEEFVIMKEHTVLGNEALLRVSELKDDDTYLRFAKEITLFHHEKWDGSGYPYGLIGEDIPISARIMALADVYDALRSTRPYKIGFTHETAMNIILKGSGKHFDPKLVSVFIEYNSEFNGIFMKSIDEIIDISNL